MKNHLISGASSLIANAPVAMALLDTDMCYIAASPKWITDHGLSGTAITGKSHYDIFPEIPEQWKQVYRRCLAGGTEHCEEEMFVRQDGSIQWLKWDVKPWATVENEISGIIIYTEDITASKMATTVLQASESRFREMIENCGDAIALVDGSGTLIYQSASAERIYGFSLEDITGLGNTDLVHPDDQDSAIKVAANSAANPGIPQYFTHRLKNKNGQWIWSEGTINNLLHNEHVKAFVVNFRDISVRKENENKLIESEACFKAIFNSPLQCNVKLLADGTVTQANNAALYIGGLTLADVIGQKFWRTKWWQLQTGEEEKIIAYIQRVNAGETIRYETVLYGNKGPMPVECSLKPVFNHKNEVIYILAEGKLIQEMAETRERLKESEELFKLAFENSAIGMSIIDKEGNWVEVNDNLCSLLGYSREELLFHNFRMVTHPDDLVIQMALKQDLIEKKRSSYQLEKRVFHKDGHILWVYVSSSLVRDKEGNIKHFVSQVQNITAKKEAELLLKEERNLLRTLIDNLPVNIYIKDLQSRKVLVNRSEYEFMGASSEAEVLGKDDYALYPYEAAKAFVDADQQIFRSGNPVFNQEFLVKRNDASERWFLLSKIPLRDDAGAIKGLLGISFDITERKAFEKELLHTQNLLTQAEAISSTGSIEINFITGERKWSDEFYRILGLAPGSIEPTAEAFVSFLHPDDKEKYLTWFYGNITQKVHSANIETRIIRADGEVRNLYVYGIGIIDENNVPEKIFGVMQDITERKKAEEKILQVQKLLERAESIAQIGSAEVDFITKNVIWSGELYRMLGLVPHSLDVKFGDLDTYLPGEEKLRYSSWIEHGLKNKLSSNQLESKIIRPDGEVRNVMIYGNAEYDEKGIPQKLFGVFKDVTDDKKNLRELETAKQVYQSLFYQNPAAVFSLDLDGNFTSANNVFAEKTEMFVEEVLTLNFTHFAIANDASTMQMHFEAAKNGNTQQFEANVVTATGRVLLVAITVLPIIVDGIITGVYGIANDISEIKRQEKIDALEKDIWRFFNNKQNTIESIIEKLLNGLQRVHPDMLCSVLKLKEGKLYNWSSPHLPEAYTNAIEGLDAESGNGSCGTAAYTRENVIVSNIETDVLWKDYRALAARYQLKACWSHPIIDSNQNLLGTFAIYHQTVRNISVAEQQSIERAKIILTNIIENKKAEEELGLKEKALSSAISGIGMTDLDGTVIYANDALCKMWGCLTKSDILGKTLADVFEGKGIYKTIEALHTKGFETGEGIGRKMDGTLFNVAFTGNMIYDENGQPVRMFGSYIDITESKRTQLALKQSHELLQKLTDQLPVAIYQFKMTADDKMSFEFVSTGITSVMPDVTPAKLQENVLLGFSQVHPDDKNLFKQSLFESRDKLKNWDIDYRIVTADGKILWHKVSAHPEQKDDGSVVWYGYFQDITAHKQQEQEREQLILELSQNNKDLRHFSYITSHNLRAPLSNLVGLVSLIDDMPVDDRILAELLKGFKTSTFLLNETVNDLLKVLTIKDNLSIQQEPIILNNVMEKVLSQIQLMIDANKPDIHFDFSLCPAITFNKVYMESIFLNLITNAVKYRSPKRQLTITVTSKTDGDKPVLIFEDNGLGIDIKRYKDRLFGLYQRFHNHPDSKGFGLYMVKSQMEALGGGVDMISEVDKGTKLVLTFKGS